MVKTPTTANHLPFSPAINHDYDTDIIREMHVLTTVFTYTHSYTPLISPLIYF